MSGLLHGLLHLFYPRLCEGCGKSLVGAEQVLCITCVPQLPVTSYHHVPDNDTVLRIAGRFPFVHATSFAYFSGEGLLQHLLHGLKYKDKKDTGIYLGKLFGYELQNTDWIKSVDAIVPIPLHAKKYAARGYNQSAYIAEGISDVLGKPVWDQALTRMRHTESQTNKTRTERIENMQDAFAIKDATLLTGKHLLLIDDVLTTGATIEAAALALLEAVDTKVSIATIGIAV